MESTCHLSPSLLFLPLFTQALHNSSSKLQEASRMHCSSPMMSPQHWCGRALLHARIRVHALLHSTPHALLHARIRAPIRRQHTPMMNPPQPWHTRSPRAWCGTAADGQPRPRRWRGRRLATKFWSDPRTKTAERTSLRSVRGCSESSSTSGTTTEVWTLESGRREEEGEDDM